MQRRITLLRHGHAAEHSDDFSRALSAAGRQSAVRAGEALGRAGWQPAHVLSSAAPRALATAQLAAKAAGFSGRVVAERNLYLATDEQCLDALRRVPERASSVLLVAHNPGLSRLARDLCGHESELAPAEYASIELELDAWTEL